MLNRTLSSVFFAAIFVMLSACSKLDVPKTAAVSAPAPVKLISTAPDQFVPKPTKIQSASVVNAGTCAIDYINPKPTVNSTILISSGKIPLVISGWVLSASVKQPVPPLIFAMLSSDTGSGTYYLEGKRNQRHDVAVALENKLLENAGFETAGYLSNLPAGMYKLSIVTGKDYLIFVCITTISVQVTE